MANVAAREMVHFSIVSDLAIGERRVLVIFPGALGDLMLAMPAIAAIARQNHSAAIELVARGELARLVTGRSVVTRGHSIDRREVTALFAQASAGESQAREFFGQFGRIYSFFAFDDPQFRAALAVSTDGAVSFHRFRHDSGEHLATAYLRSIDEPNEDLDTTNLLEPNETDFAEAKAALETAGCDVSRLFAIFPGSGNREKNWPAHNFVKLAHQLSREIDACPAVILGPAEEELRAVFRDERLPVIENLELGAVAAIARTARCFVGNDSGVSHLAATAGARGIVLFGPTDSRRWRPRGHVEIVHGSPIESITPAAVATAITRMWNGQAEKDGSGKGLR